MSDSKSTENALNEDSQSFTVETPYVPSSHENDEPGFQWEKQGLPLQNQIYRIKAIIDSIAKQAAGNKEDQDSFNLTFQKSLAEMSEALGELTERVTKLEQRPAGLTPTTKKDV